MVPHSPFWAVLGDAGDGLPPCFIALHRGAMAVGPHSEHSGGEVVPVNKGLGICHHPSGDTHKKG